MMSMQMSDSNDMIHGASSGTISGRTRLEYILMGVNIALAIAVLGFVIGVASIRTRMWDDQEEILKIEDEILKCEAQLSTTTVAPDGNVTDAALRSLTEALLAVDVNNVWKEIKVNRQEKVNITSEQQQKYFQNVTASALNRTTIQTLMALQDSYHPLISQTEILNETLIQNFLSSVMNTQVMTMANNFLVENAIYTQNLTTKIREMWFDLYSRNNKTLGSSGFEHVFAGERKLFGVFGFHNWVYFYREENASRLQYLGWSNALNLTDKGEILEHSFKWHAITKNKNTMFVGTSPELELAVYTVCFLARPNSLCPVQMDNKLFNIQTYTRDFANKTLVGSAYPVISANSSQMML